jgi:hypothetical protein
MTLVSVPAVVMVRRASLELGSMCTRQQWNSLLLKGAAYERHYILHGLSQ